jgi:hypothetical protein
MLKPANRFSLEGYKTRPRREGDARAARPKCRHRQRLGRAHHHQRRRDRRRGSRTQDKFENIGAKLVKEAASKTSDVAGDGTTTATVLAEAIFKEGYRNLTAGADAMALARGIRARPSPPSSKTSRSNPSRSTARMTSPTSPPSRQQRSRDRQHHGRRLRARRQRRRHHRRRRQEPGNLRRCSSKGCSLTAAICPQLHHQSG